MKSGLLMRMMILVFVLLFLFIFMASCAKQQSLRTVETENMPVVTQSTVTSNEEKIKPSGTEVIKRPEATILTGRNEKEEKPQRDKVSFTLEAIYFEFDRSDLTTPAKVILTNLAEWLGANSDLIVLIEGHCDQRGTNEYNLALGERRAYAAKQYLMDLGIREARLSTITYGEEKPAVQGYNESAWAKNRRGEFILK